ncbi:MAG: ribosome recycling factor [Phycisphaerales bacterium]|nr:ribosome recycling factor [Phycisphaerales bacterium]
MPVDDVLMDCEEHMEKAIEHLQHELKTIRTGRATPALVEHIQVMYYEQLTPLKSIASIQVPEATQLLIKPFQASDLKAIERAISDSNIGLTPHSDGKQLRLMLPPLSQERRVQLANQCKGFAEHAKIAIRNARRDANKVLDTEQKGGVMTEDDASSAKEQVQELTKQHETKVDELVEKKKQDIMQV